jgi:hypothetical protein
MTRPKVLKPDSKGRICLGALARGVSSFRVKRDEKCRLILEPFTEIPLQEKWVFDHPDVLNKIKKGLQESSENQTVDLGKFS